jgi:hypothetical protein
VVNGMGVSESWSPNIQKSLFDGKVGRWDGFEGVGAV